MARVGLDIDSVLYPFPERFQRFVQSYSLDKLSDPVIWKFYRDWGWEEGDFLYWHKRFAAEKHYAHGELIGGTATVDALYDLKAAGHEIVLVTARHTVPEQQAGIEEDTRSWLDDMDLPFAELHFERDKTKIDLDYFLDDRYENFIALCHKVGVISFVLDQPWNQEEFTPCPLDPWRVGSVAEYIERVLEREPGEWQELGHLTGESTVFHKESENVSSEEVRVTSETGGQKGRKDAELATVDPVALWELAKVSGFGARKYESFNYLKGYDWSLSYSAMQRHLMQFWSGQDRDEESGELHMAHAAWHCLALVSFLTRNLGTDDRPPRMTEPVIERNA